jgi:hypothetical protein
MVLFLVLLTVAILGGLVAWLFQERIRSRQDRLRRARPLPPPATLGPDGSPDSVLPTSFATLSRQLGLFRAMDLVLATDPWLVEAWILANLPALDPGSLQRICRRVIQDPGRSPALTERILERMERQGSEWAEEVAAFRRAEPERPNSPPS